MSTGSSRFTQFLRHMSPSLRKKRVGSVTKGYRLRVCGPNELIKAVQSAFKANFSDRATAMESLSMGEIQGLCAGWTQLSVADNDAFILLFYLDDEDSFLALSEFRKTIMAAKQGDLELPVLVVGCQRKMSGLSAKFKERSALSAHLVSEGWGHRYRKVFDVCQSEMEDVIEDALTEICDKLGKI